jgi:hypothetical protein
MRPSNKEATHFEEFGKLKIVCMYKMWEIVNLESFHRAGGE